MKKIGIITGAGLPSSIDDTFDFKEEIDATSNFQGPFQKYSFAKKGDAEFFIMERHGSDEEGKPLFTPAELVTKNVYEAIIYELTQVHDVDMIYGFSRVGHVDEHLLMIGDGGVIVPDQYVRGFAASQHSFGSRYAKTIHPGMGEPFDENLRRELLQAGMQAGGEVFNRGTYFYNGGDGFETKAEIEDIRHKDYLENKIVGMTTVPEVQLAAQMNTPYATMCFSVNPAEGLSKTVQVSHEQTNKEMARGEELVENIYKNLIHNLSK